MKKRFSLGFLLLLLLLFSGCGVDEYEEKTTIVLLHGWGGLSREDILMRDIYEEFSILNPDIDLNIVTVPSFYQVSEKTKDMLVVGKVPNIIHIQNVSEDSLYSFMVKEGYALNLSPYLEDNQNWSSILSAKEMAKWKTSQGELFLMPDVLRVKGYWYNRKILELAGVQEIPLTWEAFEMMLTKIQSWAKNQYLSTRCLHLDYEDEEVLLKLFYENKFSKVRDKELSKQELEEVLEAYKGFKLLYQMNESEQIFQNNVHSFNVGHTALYMGELWEKSKFTPNLETGFAFFPNADRKQNTPINANSGYMISNLGTKGEEEAALRFIAYMMSAKVQEKLLTQLYFLPANKSMSLELIKDSQPFIYESYQKIVSLEETKTDEGMAERVVEENWYKLRELFQRSD